jgi:hypothetical protein
MRWEHLREIDRVDHQRREATVARCIGNDLAREREEQARALDEENRQHVFLRETLDAEDAAIDSSAWNTVLSPSLASAFSVSTTSKSVSDSGLALTLTLMLIDGAFSRACSERGAPGILEGEGPWCTGPGCSGP